MKKIIPSNKCHGFSLVELMVALLIGLLVLAAVSQVYVLTRQTFSRVDNFSRLSHDMPFIYDNLQKDFSRANETSPLGLSEENGVRFVEVFFDSPGSEGKEDPQCGGPALRKVYLFCEIEGEDNDALAFLTVCPGDAGGAYIDSAEVSCGSISPDGLDVFTLTDMVERGTGYFDRSEIYPAAWEIKFSLVGDQGDVRPFVLNAAVRSDVIASVDQ